MAMFSMYVCMYGYTSGELCQQFRHPAAETQFRPGLVFKLLSPTSTTAEYSPPVECAINDV